MHAKLSSLVGAAFLSGCAATTATGPAAPQAVGAPQFSAAGLAGVIGRNARQLEGMFGKAELDIREGDSRKLQFTGPACVLDAYLYPGARGGEPVVSYLDARRPDGTDLDRASCVAALIAKAK